MLEITLVWADDQNQRWGGHYQDSRIHAGPLLDVGRVANGKPECSFKMGHKAEYP